MLQQCLPFFQQVNSWTKPKETPCSSYQGKSIIFVKMNKSKILRSHRNLHLENLSLALAKLHCSRPSARPQHHPTITWAASYINSYSTSVWFLLKGVVVDGHSAVYCAESIAEYHLSRCLSSHKRPLDLVLYQPSKPGHALLNRFVKRALCFTACAHPVSVNL